MQECNLCGHMFHENDIDGMKRHEEYHDPKKNWKARNKIWGVIKWKTIV